jgi:hypothetical protein
MINWQAELDALMQETMRLTKSTGVEPLIPRHIATGRQHSSMVKFRS